MLPQWRKVQGLLQESHDHTNSPSFSSQEFFSPSCGTKSSQHRGGSSLRLLHKLPHEGVLGISFPDYQKQIHSCSIHLDATQRVATLQHTSLHETVWSQMWYFTPIFWRTRLPKPFKSITKLFHPLLHTPCKISNLLVDISRYIFSLQKVGRFLVGDHMLIPDRILVELLWCQLWASGKTEEGKDPSGSRLHVFVGNRHGDLLAWRLMK